MIIQPSGVIRDDGSIEEFLIAEAVVHDRICSVVEHDGIPQVRLNSGTHIYAAAFGCQAVTRWDNKPFALPLVETAEEAARLPGPEVDFAPPRHVDRLRHRRSGLEQG